MHNTNAVELNGSLTRMNELVTELREQRKAKDRLKNEMTLIQAKIDGLEGAIIEGLQSAGLRNFEGDNAKVTVTERMSVKIPREPGAREAFFEFLKTRGVYDSLVTVNSQSLNAFYRTEEEAAVERGEIDFQIPGLETPTIYTELRVRAK